MTGSAVDEAARRAIWKHVADIPTCMMTTWIGTSLRARPMNGIARPEEVAIWFFTDATTDKDGEIRENPDACLTYADTKQQTYVSLSGTLTRINDRATLREYWSEGVSLYFPAGPEDPQVILLKFVPRTGEYWDSPSSAIAIAIKFLQAKITGERPDMGINEQVSQF